jgi:AcrR family transcriptional regulator
MSTAEEGASAPKRPTYRDKRTQETRRAIMSGAKKRLEETSFLTLSLRSVADVLGMAPSAIYRYFPSREALITALCIDSYNELADYVEESLHEVEATAGDMMSISTQWKILCHSYRSWGLEHPGEFALLFGPSQLDEVTDIDTSIAAARRFGDLGLQLFVRGLETGAIVPPQDTTKYLVALKPAFANSILSVTQRKPADFPIGLLLSGWVNIHGVICLEIFGFLATMVTDTKSFFEDHLERTMLWMGFRQDI